MTTRIADRMSYDTRFAIATAHLVTATALGLAISVAMLVHGLLG